MSYGPGISTVPLIGVADDGSYSYWGQRIRIFADDTVLGGPADGVVWAAIPDADIDATFAAIDQWPGTQYQNQDLVPAGNYLLFAFTNLAANPHWPLPAGTASLACQAPPVTRAEFDALAARVTALETP
jgi:hypothetical protein